MSISLDDIERIVTAAVKDSAPCGKDPESIVKHVISKLSWLQRSAVSLASSTDAYKKEEKRVKDNLARLLANATFLAICNNEAPYDSPTLREERLKVMIMDAMLLTNPDVVVHPTLKALQQQWRAKSPQVSFGGSRRTKRRRTVRRKGDRTCRRRM